MANHTTEAQTSGPPRRTLLFGIAATVLILDIITKVAAVAYLDPRQPVSIIGDVVTLRLIRNPGAAFSMATGMTWLLTILAVVVTIVVIRIGGRLRSRWWVLGLGLVLGGALGNLIDRIFRSPGPMRGHVVDFFSVGWFPIFNIADSAVVCGAILIVALNIFNVDPGGPAELLTGRPAKPASTDTTTAPDSATDLPTDGGTPTSAEPPGAGASSPGDPPDAAPDSSAPGSSALDSAGTATSGATAAGEATSSASTEGSGSGPRT
nr:signal peptidase II [Millisia brevis]